MSFVSFSFLFLFAAVLACRMTFGNQKVGSAYFAALIVASIVFYSWHVPAYLSLLVGSTFLDYHVSRWIVRVPKGSGRRRALLILSLAGNLGVLTVFKYGDFIISSIVGLVGMSDIVPLPSRLDLVLPLGISFYTFQSMSYTIDVYRGTIPPVDRFSRLFLFVSFFPQLVAGPIVRARDFLYQIDRRRRFNFQVFSEGVYLVIRGFFLKMVCANNIAPFVDLAFARSESGANATVLLLGALLFSCQIFCDFAGYSSIARGLAYILGFRLPVNFDCPYLARSFSEFWTRWHITLSQWLRDYLYIPLGGNRGGSARTQRNLLLTMLLGGLWHGAAWNFVIWGALQGAFLVLHRLRSGSHPADENEGLKWADVPRILLLFHAICFAWIFFRAENFADATTFIARIAAGPYDQFWSGMQVIVVVLCMFLHVAERFARLHFDEILAWLDDQPGGMVEGVILGALAGLVALFGAIGGEFIYFQF